MDSENKERNLLRCDTRQAQPGGNNFLGNECNDEVLNKQTIYFFYYFELKMPRSEVDPDPACITVGSFHPDPT